MELRGCKVEEEQSALQELREAFKSVVTTKSLENFRRSFTRMRIEIPDDIKVLISAAEEHSRLIKKKVNPQSPFEKRLTLVQLQELD